MRMIAAEQRQPATQLPDVRTVRRPDVEERCP